MAAAVAMRGLSPRFCQRVIFTRRWFGSNASSHCEQERFPSRNHSPCRAIHLCAVLCAGHNKWSKVKNIKGPKDAVRSQIFMKLTMLIRVAVKEGGPNLDFNPQLASLVEQCRSKNMPKATIEAAIKGAEKMKVGSAVTYEARGPGGSMLLIEVVTDNNTRTHQQIKHLLQKHGGTLSDGVRHSFERKGVVAAARDGVCLERALELALEAGAEDVREVEDEEDNALLEFVCEVSALRDVRSALDDLGVATRSATLEFVPCNHTVLPREQLEAASQLLDTLNENQDVVRVWDNIQAQG